MKNTDKKEEKKKLTNWQKFKQYMQSFGNIIKNGYAKITQSKAYKIITGKAVGRVIAIGSIIAAAAGLFAVAPPAFGLMIAGLITSVAVDAYMTYKTKKIYKEAKTLRDNKHSLDRQSEVLKKNPGIAKALEGKLFTPKKEGASKIVKPKEKSKKWRLNYIGGIIVSGFERVGGIINGVLTKNPASVAMGVASAIIGAPSEGGKQYSMSDTRAKLLNFIEVEKKKSYSPAYDDVKSLKAQVNKQRIQTLALEELGKIEGVNNLPPQKIQEKFVEISNNYANKANKIANRNVITKYARKIFKNVIKSHDPFSIYNDPKRLQEGIISDQPTKSYNKVKQKNKHELQEIAKPVKVFLDHNQPKNNKIKKTRKRKIFKKKRSAHQI